MFDIVIYPNPVLRREAEAVTEFDASLHTFLNEMEETMYEKDGAGLAAPQVGVSKQIIVLDPGNGPIRLMNPKIIKKSDETEPLEEGCLSLPDIQVNVTRPNSVVVEGIDENGKSITYSAEGFAAKVFQHEIDHLNGKLIIDYLSPLKRSLMKSKIRKLETLANS